MQTQINALQQLIAGMGSSPSPAGNPFATATALTGG
jgi:hypothetical protein